MDSSIELNQILWCVKNTVHAGKLQLAWQEVRVGWERSQQVEHVVSVVVANDALALDAR